MNLKDKIEALIVGLGNPGDQYGKTRHNVGFVVLDALLRDMTPSGETWSVDEKHQSLVWSGSTAGHRVVLALPQTYVNNSGRSVRSLRDYYRIENTKVWVVHDDLDLPLGKLKIREGGGSGGHRGIDSIIKHLGTDSFVRFRLGISHPGKDSQADEKFKHMDVDKFVLSCFGRGEHAKVRRGIQKVVKALKVALADGIKTSMQRYNQ